MSLCMKIRPASKTMPLLTTWRSSTISSSLSLPNPTSLLSPLLDASSLLTHTALWLSYFEKALCRDRCFEGPVGCGNSGREAGKAIQQHEGRHRTAGETNAGLAARAHCGGSHGRLPTSSGGGAVSCRTVC